jgi:mono/diheme cytochrome c family protein
MSRFSLHLGAVCALFASLGCGSQQENVPSTVTYTRDIAPILYENCAPCHRPGESGPFPLLSYTDARKRARQIADVAAARYMPPWKPEPGYGEFVGARRLTDAQIVLLQRWAEGDTPEGDPAHLPPSPTWNEGWQLGEPDLIVEMPQAYTLAAGDGDVFRNFVIPLPLTQRRYVRALELRPGNPQVVHHAVIMMDRDGVARNQDARDAEPGFGGMEFGEVQRPGGHFLGWAPGTTPYVVPDSLAWTLEAGNDLVLQLHMLPSGKPELVQARVGFFFSDTPPTRSPLLLRLGRKDIDIPAQEARYVIEDSYVLPADVNVLSVYPHAHYLGKTMEAYASLPDGTTQWLIRIDDWDFNWQNYYRYVEPVTLPRGTQVHMRYVYDNSSSNDRNPNFPPHRVTYGTQSSDEMGDLILQVLPRTNADGEHIRRDFARKWLQQEIAGYETLLNTDPDNADHHHILGLFYLSSGNGAKAAQHLQATVRLRPDFPEGHLNLATVLMRSRKNEAAVQHLRQALVLRPAYGDAHLNLGMLLGQMGKTREALTHLDTAAQLQPALAEEIGELTAKVRASLRR